MTTYRPADYTPNPKRAIHLQGSVDQEMVYRLSPDITKLLKNRRPITVYIDSPGGRLIRKDAILNLLRSSSQSNEPPVRLITVSMAFAASAAADLLSAGDYALAYPHSRIVYHGVREPSDEGPITAEESHKRTHRLRTENETYATQLARDTEERFIFRFISKYRELDDVRQKNPGEEMSDLRCFLSILAEQVSPLAFQLMMVGYERYGTYAMLLDSANRQWKRGAANKKTFIQLEVEQINAIAKFEVKRNKTNKDWNFENEGIYRLTDDFFLLNEYLRFVQGPRFRDICTTWGTFLLTQDQSNEVAAIPDESDRLTKIVELAVQRCVQYGHISWRCVTCFSLAITT